MTIANLPTLAFAVVLASGCAGDPPPASHSPRDPANPGAPETPMPAPMLASTASHPSEGEHHAQTVSTTAGDAAGVMYACPMHPDVMSDQPGRCPKCGMNLAPIKP